MRKYMKITLSLVTVLFLFTICITAYSQDVNGGPNSAFYLNRANQAAGNSGFPQPLQANPGQPPPGVSPQEFARFQQGNQVLTGQPGQPVAPPPPEIKMITVVEGELVISAKSGEILQKPERKQVPESLKDNYYDDGTHGDEVANDQVYSNVVVRKDVISKDEFKQRTVLETLIHRITKDSPVEFYRLYVASNGPNPEIPTYSYWKSRRDEFISDYKTRVLAPYKDANGNFYELYEPPKVNVPQENQPQFAGGAPAQQQPQNVGLATAVQGRVDDAGLSQVGVGGGSYFGERNR